MLKVIFGNDNAEKVLFSVYKGTQPYGTGIAKMWEIPVYAVQKQLQRFEKGGVISATLAGRTRMYQLNPRYPFKNELENMLARSFEYLPQEDKDRFKVRKRPRRTGKAL